MEWFSSFVFYGGYIHPLAWDHELCMRCTNKRLDGLIVISSYLEAYYRRSKREILLVPPLCQYPEEKPRWVADDSIFRIGYFGQPTEKDGIYDLVESMRLLAAEGRAFEFLLAGDDGRPGHLVRVRRIVAESELLRTRTKILGMVPQERIAEVFRECHVLVMARPNARFSRAGMPQKLPEYMALGRPVVVSNVGDIGRYVRDRVDGRLVEAGRPEKFAGAIAEIMDLPDRGLAMGRSAWRRGGEVFNAETHAGRILDFFERIVADHKCNMSGAELMKPIL
jgi:glycosyltransferase involved in cell wall biosynthesis